MEQNSKTIVAAPKCYLIGVARNAPYILYSMKQTVLNSTTVPGVLFLYYLAIATAIASGVFCVLFLGILLSNYFAPYSPEKLDRMIAESGETGIYTGQAGAQSSASGADIDPAKLAAPPALASETKSAFNLLPSEYKELLDLRHQLAQDTGNTAIRERMPAKSTYFYPKLLTGLVFNPLE